MAPMQLLDEMIGRKVTVFSVQGGTERQDVGVLEAVDGTWIKVKKGEAETLYFHAHHIRVIKPFDAH